MDATSITLLDQLRTPRHEQAWDRFVREYRPLLLYWARRLGLREEDAADLVQDVLIVLIRKMPGFEYQTGKSFRGWMRSILINKWRDRRQSKSVVPLDDEAQPAAAAECITLEGREHQLHVMGKALRFMASAFEPATWVACWETVVCGRPAAAVAAELGLTANAVYLARSRVLARLREELRGVTC